MIDQNFKVSNEKLTPKETHDIIRGIDENGNEILNQYTILLDIGEGSFSRIKLFIDNNTDIQYAAKIINIKELEKKRRGIKRTEQGKIIIDSCLKNALREIAILKRLSCENIIQLNEIIYDDFHSRIYLILDFADKGQILDFDHEHEAFTINKDLLLANREEYYTEDEIRDYMKGICNAVNYCK